MRAGFSCAVGFLLLFLLLPGCGAPPASLLHAPYFPSRDGALRYRLPAGWFDATNDSQAVGNSIWLLREDYGATISVSEVHMDDDARRELNGGGLLGVARLSMGLAAGGKAVVVQKAPQLFTMNGNDYVSYEYLVPASGDEIRVVVLSANGRFFMVTALSTRDKRSGGNDVFAVEQEFVAMLRW